MVMFSDVWAKRNESVNAESGTGPRQPAKAKDETCVGKAVIDVVVVIVVVGDEGGVDVEVMDGGNDCEERDVDC